MHQISPSPAAEATGRGALASPFRQPTLIEDHDAFAHLEGDLDAIVQEACRVAASGTRAGFAGVLQYREDEGAFVLQAGVGWPSHKVGRTRVAANLATTAGVAWLTGQLVHFRQLDAAGRIRAPEAPFGRGARRMVSVPIHGGDKAAFGVLEVGNADAGEFTRDDLAFLQGTADSVAAAVGRHASRAGQAERAELLAERWAALARGLDAAPGRHIPAGTRYQQDTQVGGV